jgi:hypothetical protein
MGEGKLLILILILFLLLIIAFLTVTYFKKKIVFHEVNNQRIKAKENINNQEITVQDDDSSTFDLPFTLQKVDDTILASADIIETSNQLTVYSNELFRLAKSNAPFISKGKEVFEVAFSESIQEEIKKGSAKMMNSLKKDGYKRAMAINERGKIVEHENLKPVKYNPAQIKALAMNTLTVVVSQEHLKEIKKELETIQQSLSRLISMQKNKYYGRAEGSYDYLQRAYNMYLNGEINERVMNQLESIYRENISSIRSITRDIGDITSQVSNLKKKIWIWQAKEQLTKLKSIVDEYNDYEKLLKLCFMNVNGCIKLMQLYGESQNSIDHSIATTNNLLEMINGTKKQFLLDLNSYSEEFQTKLSTNNYYIGKQKEVKREINNIDAKETLSIQRTITSSPEKLYFTVDNGEVVSVHKK